MYYCFPFSQDDPKYRDIKIPNTDFNCGQKGCAVTSLANLIACYNGNHTITPDLFLYNPNLFDTSGNFKWNKSSKIASRFTFFQRLEKSNTIFREVKEYLTERKKMYYPILLQVKGLSKENEQHWVVPVKIVAGKILIHCPKRYDFLLMPSSEIQGAALFKFEK